MEGSWCYQCVLVLPVEENCAYYRLIFSLFLLTVGHLPIGLCGGETSRAFPIWQLISVCMSRELKLVCPFGNGCLIATCFGNLDFLVCRAETL